MKVFCLILLVTYVDKLEAAGLCSGQKMCPECNDTIVDKEFPMCLTCISKDSVIKDILSNDNSDNYEWNKYLNDRVGDVINMNPYKPLPTLSPMKNKSSSSKCIKCNSFKKYENTCEECLIDDQKNQKNIQNPRYKNDNK
ncbi:uncharacterized protein LOC126893839 [Daktulosphaira vitifoliae]|uniref:uncharacterized protein LOC126893839 n=1 Tax=Daktulosphaira vitifoliae TaxID=58002 RepID=UPI0021A9B420|nr:uncharacterized protein LOC126893839 [Daktulosphaira vitifoliae]